jgi:hypothetical protein
LSNFVVLPKELQFEINKSDDEKNIDFTNFFNPKWNFEKRKLDIKTKN